MATRTDRWAPLAAQLRADSIRATTAAGSGHPTSSLSAADLMAVLLDGRLRADWRGKPRLDDDRIIFSKGHAAPLLYAMFKAGGAITDEELLTLRKLGSRLEGHPTPRLPLVDVATGSLGQGLPAAVGMALGARYAGFDLRCWVLLGDSEMAEGSVYEAFELGGHYRLSQLVAIVDMNRLGQRGPTMLQWDGDRYAERARAFGWNALVIDGHDREAIDRAYGEAERSDVPTCIVARTKKGAGVSFLEDAEGWHGKALSKEDAARALAELGNPRTNVLAKMAGRLTPPPDRQLFRSSFEPPRYERGSKVATRSAFGDALRALGTARQNVVALDGEVSNSTYTERFGDAHPDRFFEMYIAEQQLVSAAVGMQVLTLVPFVATFAAFLTRAFDQIRMAAVSRAHICLVGSHAGVSIGEDGPSQMGLEDLAMMRTVSGSTVLYPACATTTVELTRQMADREGVVYMRTTREKTPVLYGPEEQFTIGGSKVLRSSSADAAAILAAGITVHEALAAHEQLRSRGIAARVVDLYSVKPIDAATVEACARECGGRLVVVEDHWPEGGLADAVCEVFAGRPAPAITRLAVRAMPGSGTPRELLDAAGIGASAIVGAVERSVSRGPTRAGPSAAGSESVPSPS
ncbi:MAG TPA: transketolase [Anaeromyxobacteraceae bacterium]|nr:transketolase [Anaeromyxobacteraceae bacterium]